MACDGYMTIWQLAPNELVQLDGARGTKLRITRGTLWITLERDLRDIVLDAGDTFTIDRGGVTVIEAQGAATVCVDAHSVDVRRGAVAALNPIRRFGAWLGGLILNAERQRRWVPYV